MSPATGDHLNDRTGIHYIANGLGHLDASLIQHKAMGEHALVGSRPGRCHTSQQTALKPACRSTDNTWCVGLWSPSRLTHHSSVASSPHNSSVSLLICFIHPHHSSVSFIHSLSHSLIESKTDSLIRCAFIHLFLESFNHLSVHSHSCICLFVMKVPPPSI